MSALGGRSLVVLFVAEEAVLPAPRPLADCFERSLSLVLEPTQGAVAEDVYFFVPPALYEPPVE